MNIIISDLPTLPRSWVWTKVGILYDIIGGGTPSTEVAKYWKGEIPWITSADIYGLKDIRPRKNINEEAIEKSATNLVPIRSLIVVTRVGLGKIALSQYPLCFSQDSQALIGNILLIHPEYSLYYLSKAVQVFKYKNRGTTISGVTKKQLSELEYPLPPFPEQRRIVAKIEELFTKLDAGVDAINKIKLQLRQYRQAVLKYAFEGKLTAEWREVHKDKLEPASVLLERIRQEREKSTKDKTLPPLNISNLPKLSEGWEWTRVYDLSELIQYGYTAKSSNNPIGPKMLRITDIQNNTVDWAIVPYCQIDQKEKQKYLLDEGHLVFARTGATVGKSFLIKRPIPEAVFASYLIRIIFSEYVEPRFVYYYFQSSAYWLQIYRGQLGIGQPNVNSQTLSRLILPLAPHVEQQKIVEEVERCFSIADQIELAMQNSVTQAYKLKQSILKSAFEGKLVPQNPADEPAEKLLERIKAERAAKETKNKIKAKQRRLI